MWGHVSPDQVAQGGTERSSPARRIRIDTEEVPNSTQSGRGARRHACGNTDRQALRPTRFEIRPQFYAKISPTTLNRAYDDAGYFSRNMRTIEVLVDRDAITSGAAAAGEPWQHYDLGHGYCTYTFFEQCPHRMDCAHCDFNTPKSSTNAQLLEAKDNLQRMLANIPLTDDERAAVEDGQTALDQLLECLADVPTPTGATPLQLGISATATLLPIVAVNQGKPG